MFDSNKCFKCETAWSVEEIEALPLRGWRFAWDCCGFDVYIMECPACKIKELAKKLRQQWSGLEKLKRNIKKLKTATKLQTERTAKLIQFRR